MTDPYVHHPGLRGKLTPVEESFFRDFTSQKLRAIALEHGMPVDWWYTDQEREARRHASLAGRMDADMWVFAYGSLMWDPALEFVEVRRARVEGYSRKFILKETNGGRGTAEVPGMIAALDLGSGCDGLVLRLAQETLDEETAILWRREVIGPGYIPAFLQADTALGTVEALTFLADHNSDNIDATLSHETTVSYIARASGVLGTSADYLRGIVEKLRVLRIYDADVETLLADVEAYIRSVDGPDA